MDITAFDPSPLYREGTLGEARCLILGAGQILDQVAGGIPRPPGQSDTVDRHLLYMNTCWCEYIGKLEVFISLFCCLTSLDFPSALSTVKLINHIFICLSIYWSCFELVIMVKNGSSEYYWIITEYYWMHFDVPQDHWLNARHAIHELEVRTLPEIWRLCILRQGYYQLTGVNLWSRSKDHYVNEVCPVRHFCTWVYTATCFCNDVTDVAPPAFLPSPL